MAENCVKVEQQHSNGNKGGQVTVCRASDINLTACGARATWRSSDRNPLRLRQPNECSSGRQEGGMVCLFRIVDQVRTPPPSPLHLHQRP